jgi:pyrrolysine biosynthesis protein PylD
MTRLTRSHIGETQVELAGIDDALRLRANTDLKGVALTTIGVTTEGVAPLPYQRVAVVAMTSGDGIIAGFAETLVAIADHIGLEANTTPDSDVSGIAQAYTEGCDIMILADDDRFVAINTKTGQIADNNRATGEGFAVLLDLMAGGVRAQPCGVIGCGPVGSHAASRLVAMGAELTLCDIDEARASDLAARLNTQQQVPVQWVSDTTDLLAACPFVVDASPCGGILSADLIDPRTVITAPGVPLGLTPDALARIGPRCYHDKLPLGVATMLLAAVYGRMTDNTGW